MDAATISIHAPREGCDRAFAPLDEFMDIFQSTHPARGATLRRWALKKKWAISIHAPREGCDGWERIHRATGDISIHAPREGCDAGIVSGSITIP